MFVLLFSCYILTKFLRQATWRQDTGRPKQSEARVLESSVKRSEGLLALLVFCFNDISCVPLLFFCYVCFFLFFCVRFFVHFFVCFHMCSVILNGLCRGAFHGSDEGSVSGL